MRRLSLALGLAVLAALPASASATVTMTDFKVEPNSRQGGGHPSVTITQAFSPVVLADGARMRPISRRRSASMPFPREVRSARIVWRGLRAGRRLRRRALVRLTIQDARNHLTTLKPRVRVRRLAPRRG